MKALRGETFVTRKISRGLSRIDAGLEECLYMGNLDSLRDGARPRLRGDAVADVAARNTRRFRNRHRPPGKCATVY